MSEGRKRRRRGAGWALDEPSFERLLAVLDSDRERAALAYEALHRRLCGLLRWWGAAGVEELADESLDRVARQLDEGLVFRSGSLGKYVQGVARMIYFESTRRAAVFESRSDPPEPLPAAEDRRLDCLEKCLAGLEARDRDLVLRYYDEGDRAEVRKRLAGEMAISGTALRIRAHRIRERLEACVRSRFSDETGRTPE